MTILPDFPCLNEEYGLECEYPFCDCELMHYEGEEVIAAFPEVAEDEEAEFDFLEDFDEDEW